jgi:hypothetical protein
MRKCKICGRDIESDVLYKGDYDQINVSTIWPGEVLDMDGHRTCLNNINELIIKPNRDRFVEIMNHLSKTYGIKGWE